MKDIKEKYLFYYPEFKLLNEIETQRDYKICFSNGDAWEAFSFSESACRGKRANIIYVDNKIIDSYKDIIMPCLTAPPYNGIMVY